MNEELLERLAGKRGSVHPTAPRASSTSGPPLNYQSTPAEVKAWLSTKGFSQQLSMRCWRKLLLTVSQQHRKPVQLYPVDVLSNSCVHQSVHLIANDVRQQAMRMSHCRRLPSNFPVFVDIPLVMLLGR